MQWDDTKVENLRKLCSLLQAGKIVDLWKDIFGLHLDWFVVRELTIPPPRIEKPMYFSDLELAVTIESFEGLRQQVPEREHEVELIEIDGEIIIHPGYNYLYPLLSDEEVWTIKETIMLERYQSTFRVNNAFYNLEREGDDYLALRKYHYGSCVKCTNMIIGFFASHHRNLYKPLKWSCSHGYHDDRKYNPDAVNDGGLEPIVAPQGKTKSVKRYYSQIKKNEDCVWEFGYCLDLSSEQDMAKLLELTSNWLRVVQFSKKVDVLNKAVKKWIEKKPHRKAILHMLRQCGDSYAKLYLCSYSGKLTQERYSNWKHTEAQFVSDFISVAWLCIVLWGIWKMHQHKDAILAIPNLASNINRFAEPAGGFMNIVEKTVDNVVEAGKTVLNFFKDLVDRVIKRFEDMDHYSKALIKGLLKVTLVIVAFEFARTMFPDIYVQVRDYVAAACGYEVTKMTYEEVTSQGDDDESVLTDILKFISTNFVKMPFKKFLTFCDKLPKIVSVAKAIQWIFENFGKLIGWIQEMWTGEPHPKTQLELDIQAFYVAVEELRVSFSGMTSEELFSEDVQLKVALVKQEKERINQLVVRAKDMRAVFTGRFNQGVTSLVNLEIAYGQNRKRAEKRTVPIWVYIYGEPGIGKSHDLEQLYVMVWNYLHIYGENIVEGPFHNGHLFELNQSEEFFDGYKQQIFMTIDDIFQSRDLDIRARTAERMIHFISPAQYSLRVATVEEKAHCFFTSRCIFTTANMAPHEITDTRLNSPEALTSRITLALQKTKYGYIVDKLTPLTIEGKQSEVYSLEDIAAVIGESIIIKDRQKAEKVPDIIPSKLKFSLNSARFKVEAQGKDKEKESDEEKEKEFNEEEQIRKAMKDLAEAEVTKLDIEAISAWMKKNNRDARAGCLFFWVQKTRNNYMHIAPEPGELPVAYLGRVGTHDQMYEDFLKESPVALCSESCQEVLAMMNAQRGMNFRTAAFVLLIQRSGILNLGGLTPNSNETYEEFKKRVLSMDEKVKRAREKCNARKAKNRSQTFNEFKGEFEDKKGFIDKYWKPFTKIWRIDGDTWYFKRVPDGFKEIFKMSPGLILCPWKGTTIPKTFSQWIEIYNPKSRELSEEMGYEFDWDFYEEMWDFMKDIAKELDDDPNAFVAVTGKPVHFDVEYKLSSCRFSLASSWALLGAGAAIYGILIYKIVRMCMPSSAYINAQAAYEEKISKQQKLVQRARIEKKPNVLRKGKVENQGGVSELARMIANNGEILEVRLSGPDEKWSDVENNPVVASCWVTFVYSTYALVPRHTMFGVGINGEKKWFSLVRNQKYHVSEAELDFIETVASDIVLVRFPDLQEKRDISRLFVDKLPTFGRMMHVQPDQRGTSYLPQVAMAFENKTQEIPVNSFYGSFETDAIFYGIENEKGMCGTMYVHEATGKVVAMHMGGNKAYRTAYGVLLQKSDIEKFNPKFNILDPIPTEMVTAQAIEGVTVLGQVPRKLGSYIPSQSSLKIGMLDYATFPVPETDSAPAKLVPFDLDGVRVSPLQNAVDKFARQYRPPKVHKEPETVIDFFPVTFNYADAGKLSTIREAIFGIPGYMKSIDFTASAGYYYKKKGLTRRDLCFDEKGNPRIHPLLEHDVEMILHAIKKGCVYPVVFEEQLKDELKTKEKSDTGMTRLYSSGDFASFVVQRMYLGRFFTEITKDPVGSPIGLSINPHSSQWGLLYARLRGRIEEKRRIRAGDFSNYDISIKNEVERRFLELLGHCFHGDLYVEVCLVVQANFHGWHVLGVIVFVRPWGTSSGSFITSIFNSFGNWYLHKTAFINLFGEDEWRYVETTFTGDDSVVSVPEKFEAYDMRYLSKFFKEHYGMTYTSPTKTDDMNVTWESLVYLKRQFVMGEKGVMAPLDKKSLANMVKWTDTEQDEEVLSSIIQSVLLEAWHHGESFYSKCYSWAKKEAQRLNIRTDVRSFYRMNVMRDPDY